MENAVIMIMCVNLMLSKGTKFFLWQSQQQRPGQLLDHVCINTNNNHNSSNESSVYFIFAKLTR
uniref:Uncharacterized protein n=1 Tax=Rhizophora mucronata TaxID=61149 RepID=A0A2P2LLC6_RHIMU